MNSLHELFSRFETAKEKTALVTSKDETTYEQLLAKVQDADLLAREYGCEGITVLLVGDYAPSTIACLLALWRLGNVVALCCATQDARVNEYARLVQAARVIKIGEGNSRMYFLNTPETSSKLHPG